MEILQQMNQLRKEYSKASGTSSTITKYPKQHLPQPTTDDYRIGYIERYFAKSRTNIKGQIIEISKDEYNKLTAIFPASAAQYYKVIKLRWMIKGTSGDLQRKNSRTLLYQQKNMPGITLYLGNLLQFWQG